MLEIDGSYGEGGGQLVRTAVALSAITGTAVRLEHVRAQRDKPGLAPQHLAAVRAVAQVCGAECAGLELRSQAFDFAPRALRSGAFRFDVGTAGSVTLVLQALLPVLACAPRSARVTVVGGTDVRAAPPLEYFGHVLLALLDRMGLHAALRTIRRGYYPRGGGEVEVTVVPARPAPLVLDRLCAPARIDGLAHVAHLPMHIAERGVRAETLGEAAGAELAADLAAGAALDVHAADQVLVYLALARGGRFTTRSVTSHTRTVMWLIEQFLPVRFDVGAAGALARIEVRAR